LKHGNYVKLTLKDKEGKDKELEGTVVRVVLKEGAGRLFLRSKAGQPPTPIDWPAVGQVKRDAVPVSLEGRPTKVPVRKYEIDQLMIRNGQETTFSYAGPRLSRREKDGLGELEAAEHTVARLERYLNLTGKMLAAESGLSVERQKSQELVNQFLQVEL